MKKEKSYYDRIITTSWRRTYGISFAIAIGLVVLSCNFLREFIPVAAFFFGASVMAWKISRLVKKRGCTTGTFAETDAEHYIFRTEDGIECRVPKTSKWLYVERDAAGNAKNILCSAVMDLSADGENVPAPLVPEQNLKIASFWRAVFVVISVLAVFAGLCFLIRSRQGIPAIDSCESCQVDDPAAKENPWYGRTDFLRKKFFEKHAGALSGGDGFTRETAIVISEQGDIALEYSYLDEVICGEPRQQGLVLDNDKKFDYHVIDVPALGKSVGVWFDITAVYNKLPDDEDDLVE